MALAAAVSGAPACSVVGVETVPPVVQPDTRLHCTATYWLPAADVVGMAALIGYAAWDLDRNREGCADGDPDRCDGQAGMVVLLPVGHLASAIYGLHAIRRCRKASSWQRETPLPHSAGAISAACVPTFDREGRCEQGYCVRGRCQAERPPVPLRRRCAGAIARWRVERDPGRRARLHAELPPDCRSLAR